MDCNCTFWSDSKCLSNTATISICIIVHQMYYIWELFQRSLHSDMTQNETGKHCWTAGKHLGRVAGLSPSKHTNSQTVEIWTQSSSFQISAWNCHEIWAVIHLKLWKTNKQLNNQFSVSCTPSSSSGSFPLCPPPTQSQQTDSRFSLTHIMWYLHTTFDRWPRHLSQLWQC